MLRCTFTLSVLFLFLSSTLFAQNPNAENDDYSTEIDATLSIFAPGVLANDTDPDGDTLSVVSFMISSVTYAVGETATLPEGSFTLLADGSFTFVPTLGFTGNIPTINYTVSDGMLTASASIFIAVIEIETEDDYDTVEINTTLSVSGPGVLANDSNTDGAAMFITSFTINGVTYNAGETATIPQGNITLFADGSYTIEPTPGFTGEIPTITYTASVGEGITNTANLFLTVEEITNLIRFNELSSCNQGFDINQNYETRYIFSFSNTSTARDYHDNNLIGNVDLTLDLDAVFGEGCVESVEVLSANTSPVQDFVDAPYPLDFNEDAINPDFLDGISNTIFSPGSIANAILYPRQTVTIELCFTINPFCGGRPNPTPSGSGIDFEAVFDINSTIGNDSISLNLTDFHTSEGIVRAGIFIPETVPLPNVDGTYDYTNTIILSNEGNAVANNVNFNMGLGEFFANGINFSTLTITQVSGPPVTLNTAFNGNTETLLLAPNNSLDPGEAIVLDIFHLTNPIQSATNNIFNQYSLTQTQGNLDGQEEDNPTLFSYVIWQDGLGNHLDRYHLSNGTTTTLSNDQCACDSLSMSFSFQSSSTANKTATITNTQPNGILEHEEVTFLLTVNNSNTSDVQLNNLQILENLQAICTGEIVSVSSPTIFTSTATTNPNLNANFNGTTDINIFDGTSGLLLPNESISVELIVVFNEDCAGTNGINFLGIDPVGNSIESTSSVSFNGFTDTDNDGISNSNDIDDDNDTIPDIIEYNGNDPLADDDNDLIPNYRDINFGADTNADGIVDLFDFDGDGVPNHLDLDSDNDGIFDIVEVGNTNLDTNNSGLTNNPVGFNGLDNTIETSDGFDATINFIIADTDADTLPNYTDIDADADGIVDNIEAQPTDSYTSPSTSILETGINTAYPNGLSPVDTETDGTPDYIDTNTDDDIRLDVIEGWDIDSDGIAETNPSGIDNDNDGLDDAFDTNTNAVNPTNGQVPTDFPNADYNITPERDWRELIAIVVLIDNVVENEGGTFTFTINLVTFNDNTIPIQSTTDIVINLNTQDGTNTTNLYDVAIAPFDYTTITNQDITIAALTDTIQFSVTSLDDIIYEIDELYSLIGTITTNNTITDEIVGIGTIVSDDPEPNISMNNAIALEGNNLEYTITLSHPSGIPIVVTINTINQTATAPEDYDTLSADFTIAATIDPDNTNTAISYNIPTLLDNLNELDEEFLNVFGTVKEGDINDEDLTKTGTIIDIDPDPFVVVSDATVVEGNTLNFEIQLLNADNLPMSNYLPISFNLQALDITTTITLDYSFFSINAFVPEFQTSYTQPIPTFDDRLNEDTETMNLLVTLLSTGVSNQTSTLFGLGTIKDNDFPNLFSPNNDGISDEFHIRGLEDFPNFKLIIVDRWGSEIYNYNNAGNPSPIWWDGTRDGQPVIEGVYFYTLDFNDGVTPYRTGFIQLTR